MSVQYCLACLKPSYMDEDTDCPNHDQETIFGELRVAYMRGYRDAQAGLEPQL